MRLRTALCLATFFLTFLTVAAWSAPALDQPAPARQPAPDTQSISGKISSIQDAAFTLDVAKGTDVSTLQFLVDEQTKVQGSLRVGSPATVEYRSSGGKNIAVHVVVVQNSGISSY